MENKFEAVSPLQYQTTKNRENSVYSFHQISHSFENILQIDPPNFSQFSTRSRPNDHFFFSIASIFLFNIIFGLVALICSLKSRDAYDNGRYEESKYYSNKSLTFNFAALVFYVLFCLIVVVFLIFYVDRIFFKTSLQFFQ
jgi:hypothetical protein